MQLRPLSLGELLDRAVTLCVRHALTFALIFLVFIVPFMIVQAFALPDQTAALNQLVDMVRSGGKVIPRAGTDASAPALTFVWLGVFWLFSSLSYAALIVATSRAYLEGSASFAAAYRLALRFWPRLIALTLLYVLAAAVVLMAASIIGVVILAIAMLLSRALVPLGIIFGVIVGGAFALAVIALALVAMIAGYLMCYALVLEGASIAGAFVRGLQRAFGRGNLLRSLGAGLALAAVSFGFTILVMVVTFALLGIFHSALVGQLLGALVQAPVIAFFFAFLTLFYYDLRVRNEGFDLRVDAAAPAPVSAALID
jgi:hypothetical protein